ncbi:low affinity iron permease family protein [Nocardia carnea]|uniref:low affinity iron permease family protein n=1 Tax=Nocardia carnea TaxID=37328 RepID=UPI002454086C|nr:low affinity iron permease family protein [Nocardia carnea]
MSDRDRSTTAVMPSDIHGRVSVFDRFAGRVSAWVSRAWFFSLCVAIVVIWAPSIVLLPLDTWQLIINTITTIITFLMVALLQNTQKRSDDAVQQKLNAIADSLADLMATIPELAQDRRELLQAVGLEDRESTA